MSKEKEVWRERKKGGEEGNEPVTKIHIDTFSTMVISVLN